MRGRELKFAQQPQSGIFWGLLGGTNNWQHLRLSKQPSSALATRGTRQTKDRQGQGQRGQLL